MLFHNHFDAPAQMLNLCLHSRRVPRRSSALNRGLNGYWCPSCTARRASETGLHLATVLPLVAHRQWTLSLPYSLRYSVVKRPWLLKRLEVQLVKAIWRHQRRLAVEQGRGFVNGGAVCFTQWFGSRLQLTPHLHLLVPQAMWAANGERVELGPPDETAVAAVLKRTLLQARKD